MKDEEYKRREYEQRVYERDKKFFLFLGSCTVGLFFLCIYLKESPLIIISIFLFGIVFYMFFLYLLFGMWDAWLIAPRRYNKIIPGLGIAVPSYDKEHGYRDSFFERYFFLLLPLLFVLCALPVALFINIVVLLINTFRFS